MDSNEIWVSIILPLLLAQACMYIKSFYDNYMTHKNDKLKFIFDEKITNLKNVLQNFYWPLYIKLLCIYQLNYNIPIKNQYEYISSDSDTDFDDETLNGAGLSYSYYFNGINNPGWRLRLEAGYGKASHSKEERGAGGIIISYQF